MKDGDTCTMGMSQTSNSIVAKLQYNELNSLKIHNIYKKKRSMKQVVYVCGNCNT